MSSSQHCGRRTAPRIFSTRILLLGSICLTACDHQAPPAEHGEPPAGRQNAAVSGANSPVAANKQGSPKGKAETAPSADDQQYQFDDAPIAMEGAPKPAPRARPAPPLPSAAGSLFRARKQRARSPKGASRFGLGAGGGLPVAQAPLRLSPEFNTEAYASVKDNAFVTVEAHPLSTFSSDVDTASYSNGRRFINQGRLPPKDSVRVEEWVNYFSYDYPSPRGAAPIAISSEVSSCPWNGGHQLARVGIKARPIDQDATPPRNLVFLLDVSGSMQSGDKLPLLKRGFSLLVRTLRPEDSVAIAVYAGASGVVLPPTPGSDRGRILAAIERLEAGGSTNGGEGITLAYGLAQAAFKKGGINRVILATDGDFNVGTTSQGALVRMIENKRESGVFLTVLGFGSGNLKDSTMELLADKGNGNYAYIDSLGEARKVLVKEAGATLVTVAKDVKLQVEFNPKRVHSYRLIGYENRVLAKEDFNDDRKDAGDMGAGHTVTALYEVVPVGAPTPKSQAPSVDPLKYQAAGNLAGAAHSAELFTVKVRYKEPSSKRSSKLSHVVVDDPQPFGAASPDHQLAATVAHFAQVLRGTPALEGASLGDTEQLALRVVSRTGAADERDLFRLIERAKSLN